MVAYYKMSYMQFLDDLKNIPNIEKNPLDYIFEREKVKLDNNSLLLEFGVYNGHTINYISKKTNLTVYGFDSFEGLPESWDRKDMTFIKGAFSTNGQLPKVNNNVTLIKGWFNETLQKFIDKNNKPIKFIHIDCDIYSSTKTIFDTLLYKIGNDCIIVFDELVNYEGFDRDGELRAFYEFIKENKIKYRYIGMNGRIGDRGHMHEKVAIRIISNPKYKKIKWKT